MRRTALGGVALLVMAGTAMAQPGRLPATKKLIEYGWDVPQPAFVAANLAAMEKRPFDGVIMRLAGKHGGNIFSGGKWNPSDYEADVKAMQSIRWGTFRHNFLMMYSASEQDWLSDSDWEAVVSNVEIMARCAAAGGCSLAFDAEPYGFNPWSYAQQKHAKTTTYADYAAKAHQRGQQFIEAIGRTLPGNVLLTFFTYSQFPTEMAISDPAKREQALAGEGYSLYVPFLNGVLEGMGPGMTMTDGNEPSYYYDSSEKFFAVYHAMRQGALNLIPSAAVAKFQTQTQASQALYMDYVFARVPWKNIPALYLTPDERARWFEHNVYYALKTTDEYVWLYSEKMNWWTNQDVPPGMEEAIVRARTAIAENRPLGFDLRALMQGVDAKRKAAIAEKLIKRSATIPALTGAAPQLDGVFDEVAWQGAATLPDFVGYFGSTDADIKAKTSARVTYDAQNLYLAIQAADPEVAKLEIVGNGHDDAVWNGDSFDIFIASAAAGLPYYHFILNPRGVQWDAEFYTANDMAYNPTWKAATKIAGQGWCAEIAIPWSELKIKPASGLTFRTNLCRQRRTGGGELSSWSQNLTGFMEPEQFGTWTLK